MACCCCRPLYLTAYLFPSTRHSFFSHLVSPRSCGSSLHNNQLDSPTIVAPSVPLSSYFSSPPLVMSAAAAAAAGPHAGNTPSKARATRPPNSWPLGPRERPGTARTPASRLLDVGHRVLVSALILGTGYLAYQMASGVYQSAAQHSTQYSHTRVLCSEY